MTQMDSKCPCIINGEANHNNTPPSFVGNDYFCDTGSHERFYGYRFFEHDPLWDGEGYEGLSTCCSFNTPPWFYKQLPEGRASDDIEMRICRNEPATTEDVAIRMIDIYVQ